MEIWSEIIGYEGLYEVSNFGRVRNVSGHLMSTWRNNKGYKCLSLQKNRKTKHLTVHRAVAMAFIPNTEKYSQINHIDGNKDNNRVENLEWCDQQHNYAEGKKLFLYSKNENHFCAKLKNRDVFIIYKLFLLGFTRTTIARIYKLNPTSIHAIETGISYRELGINFNAIHKTRYKDLPNIHLPSDIRNYFKDNTVLNTLIAQGKVSV